VLLNLYQKEGERTGKNAYQQLKNITALLLGGVRGGKTLFKNSLYGH